MPLRASIAVVLAVASLVVIAPQLARAQHGTPGYGSMPMVPSNSAMLEQQTAEFALPGRAGAWQTWSARIEVLALPWLSLAARPELARVDYDDGRSAFGPGDSELAARALVVRLPGLRASVTAGLSVELPTGDPDDGTGNGHVSLFPFATFGTMPSRWLMLHLMAGDRVVLDGGEHAAHAHAHHGTGAPPRGSVIMPHAEHELAVHGGGCLTFAPVVISPGLEWMQVLSSPRDTFLTAQLEVALVPRRELRVAAGIDLPLLDEPRYEWRSRLMAAVLW